MYFFFFFLALDQSLWALLEVLLSGGRLGQLWSCVGWRASSFQKTVLGNLWCSVTQGKAASLSVRNKKRRWKCQETWENERYEQSWYFWHNFTSLQGAWRKRRSTKNSSSFIFHDVFQLVAFSRVTKRRETGLNWNKLKREKVPWT